MNALEPSGCGGQPGYFVMGNTSPDDVVHKTRVEWLACQIDVVLLCKLLWHIHHLEGAQVVSLHSVSHSYFVSDLLIPLVC